MNKIFLQIIGLFCFLSNCYSDEGLWKPSLDSSTYNQIRQYCELTQKEIYNELEPSLKDAVVLFGGGCTGVVVSDE